MEILDGSTLRESARRGLALIDAATTRRLALVALAFVRIGVCGVGVFYYVSHYGERHYLFGPEGVWPYTFFTSDLALSGTFSLYAMSPSPALFETVFHLGLLIALLATFGLGGRWLVLVHWAFLWSLYRRNPVLLDGGDNVTHIVLLFLVLTACTARVSVDAWLRARRSPSSTSPDRTPPSVVTAIHNVGVVLVMVQVCIVYVTSGLYKVAGQLWQDGTAIYYVMRVPEFYLPGVSELVFTNTVLVPVLTYGTVALLVYFPLLVALRWTRVGTTLAMMSFHAGVGFFMGLTGFALTMIAVDCIFLDGPLRRLVDRVNGLDRRPREGTGEPAGGAPPPHPGPLAVDAGRHHRPGGWVVADGDVDGSPRRPPPAVDGRPPSNGGLPDVQHRLPAQQQLPGRRP